MAPLDARLLAAASFVRPGAVLADVGTDHAYLPLYLIERGLVSRAVAADIGEGPIARARAHIATAGYADRIMTVQTDGLCGLDACGITDIAICGMGGELIARILADAPFTRDPAVRLILQPMTRASALRAYLAENGYAIIAEKPCRAAGRVYSCLCAAYDGVARTLSPAEAEVGTPACKTAEEKDAFRELLARKIAAIEARVAALTHAGKACDADKALLEGLLQLRNR